MVLQPNRLFEEAFVEGKGRSPVKLKVPGFKLGFHWQRDQTGGCGVRH